MNINRCRNYNFYRKHFLKSGGVNISLETIRNHFLILWKILFELEENTSAGAAIFKSSACINITSRSYFGYPNSSINVKMDLDNRSIHFKEQKVFSLPGVDFILSEPPICEKTNQPIEQPEILDKYFINSWYTNYSHIVAHVCSSSTLNEEQSKNFLSKLNIKTWKLNLKNLI